MVNVQFATVESRCEGSGHYMFLFPTKSERNGPARENVVASMYFQLPRYVNS